MWKLNLYVSPIWTCSSHLRNRMNRKNLFWKVFNSFWFCLRLFKVGWSDLFIKGYRVKLCRNEIWPFNQHPLYRLTSLNQTLKCKTFIGDLPQMTLCTLCDYVTLLKLENYVVTNYVTPPRLCCDVIYSLITYFYAYCEIISPFWIFENHVMLSQIHLSFRDLFCDFIHALLMCIYQFSWYFKRKCYIFSSNYLENYESEI